MGAGLGLHGAHTATALTRHLEAMVQNGHEVRVGFTVGQPLPGQLEHLSCTFCVYVNLFYRKNKAESNIHFLNSLATRGPRTRQTWSPAT